MSPSTQGVQKNSGPGAPGRRKNSRDIRRLQDRGRLTPETSHRLDTSTITARPPQDKVELPLQLMNKRHRREEDRLTHSANEQLLLALSRDEVQRHGAGARRRPVDNDVARVAAELRDVSLYPAHRGALVEEADVKSPSARTR